MIQLLRLIRAAADGSDRDLLDRYAREGDQEAFAALVRRYGPGVWAACQRLADGDAEDAFQAVFLTLTRKAGSVGGSLPAWLHGVTRRIAANLRRGARRRAVVEQASARPVETRPQDAGLLESLALLDEELARLPDRYRAVLIVCCLEGRSREEAAAQLGWTDGQVKGRLERAREMLRARLQRRGLELGVLLLAASVSRPAPALAMTHLLATGTSPVALSLANGVIRAMFVQKLRVVTVMLLMAAVATGAFLVPGPQPGTAAPPEEKVGGAALPPVARAREDALKEEFDLVASFKRFAARAEGASRTFTYQADDKKWYRARVTARRVIVEDVKRTDSLITPFKGELHWVAEAVFTPPCPTEEKAASAVLGTEVVKDPGAWRGTFEFRNGRWRFYDAVIGFQPGRPAPSNPLPPTRKNSYHWAAIFEDAMTAASAAITAPSGVVWGEPVNGVRLGIQGAGADRLLVAIENVGKDDTVLNLGIMLANGKKQLPTAVRLTFTDAAKKTRTFERRVGGVAGRVDPFVVPLGAGCRYTLSCPLAEYLEAAPQGTPLAPGAYQVAAEFVGERVGKTNQDTGGLALMPYWTGTIQSGQVPVTVPKPGE